MATLTQRPPTLQQQQQAQSPKQQAQSPKQQAEYAAYLAHKQAQLDAALAAQAEQERIQKAKAEAKLEREKKAAEIALERARLEEEKRRLENMWRAHCDARYSLPPELLPLEQEAELATFLKGLTSSSRHYVTAAVDSFRKGIVENTRHAILKMRAVNRSLWLAATLAFGKIGQLLRSAKVSNEPPSDLDAATSEH